MILNKNENIKKGRKESLMGVVNQIYFPDLGSFGHIIKFIHSDVNVLYLSGFIIVLFTEGKFLLPCDLEIFQPQK